MNDLSKNLHHLAEHLADDHDGLPLHAKNTVLLAARAVEELDEYRDLIDEIGGISNPDHDDLERIDGLLVKLILMSERYGETD